jgi:hypothetical protein
MYNAAEQNAQNAIDVTTLSFFLRFQFDMEFFVATESAQLPSAW